MKRPHDKCQVESFANASHFAGYDPQYQSCVPYDVSEFLHKGLITHSGTTTRLTSLERSARSL